MPPRHPKLKCRVKTLEYDFSKKRGTIFFPENHCCDMGGCIEVFQAIDPEVNGIHTYSGLSPDTHYVKIDGEWYAINPDTLEASA